MRRMQRNFRSRPRGAAAERNGQRIAVSHPLRIRNDASHRMRCVLRRAWRDGEFGLGQAVLHLSYEIRQVLIFSRVLL